MSTLGSWGSGRGNGVAAETVSRGLGLARPGWRPSVALPVTVFVARHKIITRYKGVIVLESLLPVFFAGMPIFLGIAVAGSEEAAADNFCRNTNAACTVARNT